MLSASAGARSEIRRKSRPPRPAGRQSAQRAHRFLASSTAFATSGSRGAGAGGTNVPSRTDAATCSCASRNGTPSRTSASAASVASSSGSDDAAASRSRSNSQPVDENAERAERTGDVATRGEHRRLVLLQIAVVRERQALDRREQAGQPADRGPRLPARELGDVGVQLLRHHRRARRGELGQPRERELGARPQHELLADAREMREQHRDRVEVVEREVAVGDRVERVAHRVRRRRQRQRRAGERTRAERRRCGLRGGEGEARAVALEHLGPREQVMTERDGLRTLQVRVAGHRRRRFLRRTLEDDVRHERRRARRPPRRTRRRRRAGTPPRPGRCATGPRGSSCRPRRAAARSPSGRPRRRRRPTPSAAIRSSAVCTSASSSLESSPAS